MSALSKGINNVPSGATAVTHTTSLIALAASAIGVVFGDIGTSPLYTLKESFHHLRQDYGALERADVLGVLSMVFWSLTLVVTVKYLLFVMRAHNKGEGGIFALLALAPQRPGSGRRTRLTGLALLAILGGALLYGDGMITPAISVLSAVEGLSVTNPGLATWVVPLTCGILLALFWIQSRGTGSVGRLFAPIMLLWFGTIGVLGLYHLVKDPSVLSALSPNHAIDYLSRHGWRGTSILGSVVLAVTGGEALYADMGHFGARPIRIAWMSIVFPSLLMNYFGQGALALGEPAAQANPFFAMVPSGLPNFLLVLLSGAAAVIASQALISGAFSLTRQAIQLGYLPRLRIRHTAHEMEGQIYIPEVNFVIAAGSLMLVLGFKNSSNLAAAYGIAVTGTMAVTSIMFYVIARQTWNWPNRKALPLLLLFLSFDVPFLAVNLTKVLAGGYVPVLIAAAIGAVMIIWKRGRAIITGRAMRRFANAEKTRRELERRVSARVPGTAVFLSREMAIPPVLYDYVSRTRTLHENVILLTIEFANTPTVPESERHVVSSGVCGAWRVNLNFGFMEDPLVVPALSAACTDHGIPFDHREALYFLGRETMVVSDKGRMRASEERIFAFLHRNTTTADTFFGLPHRQVVEIGTQIDL